METGNILEEPPSMVGIFLYSVLTPFICLVGIFGNSISVFVLNKNEFKCSFYVYLRVISTVDLILCIFIFLSGFSLGAFWWCPGWVTYHNFIGIQVITFLVSMNSMATYFVTIDRLIYLRNPLQRRKPKFCKRHVARMITFASIIISIIYTLPYCFIYEITPDQTLEVTNFFNSSFYKFYNWLDFTFFGILPAIILCVGNALLIMSIRRANRIQKRTKLKAGKTRRLRDQSKITITLIAIVFFYLTCELPFHFTKPRTATDLFFGGDYELTKASYHMEFFKQVTTVLLALHLSIKFILYCLFCPPFSKALKATVYKKTPRVRKKRVKLFIVDHYRFIDFSKRQQLWYDRLKGFNSYHNSRWMKISTGAPRQIFFKKGDDNK